MGFIEDIPCTFLRAGPCVTDFTTFWILVIGTVGLPILMFILFYIIPGPDVVKAFMHARITGSPIILKWRKDMRVDLVTGKYENGIVMNKKHGGFISTIKSYGILPGGFRVANANEALGITLPFEVAQDINKFQKLGFRNLDEAQDFMEKSEVEIREALKGAEGETKEQLELRLRNLNENKAYLEELRRKQSLHQEMFVSFANLQNFFKYNINPSYIIGAVEKTVAETLMNNRKFDWNTLLYIAIIMMIVGAVAFAIIGTVDLSKAPAVGAQIGQAVGFNAADAAKVVTEGGTTVS